MTFVRIAAGLMIAAAAASAGCGSDSKSPMTPTATSASQASVTMTLSPSPATAVVCNPKCVGASGNAFDFSLAVTAVLRESAGLSANVDGMEWLISRGGALAAPLALSPPQIITGSGTNHIAAKSSLSVPLVMLYSSSSGAKDGIVSVAAHLTDEKSNPITLTGIVVVQ